MLRNRGFTLLEVLLALALLAILSAALYGTWFSLIRGEEKATAAMAGRRELRETIDNLQRELSAAFYRSEQQTDPKKERQRFHFVVEDRDFFGKPASTLNFTTLSAPISGNRPESDQTEVQYVPVEKSGKMLLGRRTRDAYLETDTPLFPQMEEIEGFLVECTTDGNKWVRSWDTSPGLNSGLPKAVRVTISVKEGEKTVSFTTLAVPRMRDTL